MDYENTYLPSGTINTANLPFLQLERGLSTTVKQYRGLLVLPLPHNSI